MNISDILTKFAADLKYEDIPSDVIENQKKSIMDAVGITLGASTLGDGCREMVEIADELAAGGREEAVVFGWRKRLPAAWAAFANASMAHSLDFGDTHQKSTIHSNSSSFPAALAIAESMGGVSGKELLTALVAGSETAIRIALAADVNTVEYGFYIPTIYSSYGATIAVAKVMGLTAEQMRSAISFNLCQTTCSSELTNSRLTAVRSVREAFAARNAIVSCYMAKKGLIGFEEPLEGRLGFYHAFLRDQYTAEKAVDGLGEKWEAKELTYKIWPCCFGNHSVLTAIKKIMREQDLSAEDIKHVQAGVGAQNKALCEPLEERRKPANAIIAKFSIPFNAAAQIVKGDVNLSSYDTENLRDPKTLEMAAKVDYTYHEDWQHGQETWADVVLETEKGTFTEFVKEPLGTPSNPMDDEAFEKKFDTCASRSKEAFTASELDAVKKAIRSFETLSDIREFTKLLQ